MSGPVSIHVPEVRLAKLIRAPGGKPVAEAMRDAAAGLETLQSECLARLSTVLDTCESLAARADGAFDPAVVRDLYDAVGRTIGVPTACGLGPVDTMLSSLADLLDYLGEQRTWEANAVAVHLRAFRLLLRTESARDTAGTQAILEGLRKVSQRYARPATETRPADSETDAAAGLSDA